ncbi:hypothetical protein NST81_02725 [Bacillus sp. FSL W8-0223]|uniref:hypothetical protein n=1 Tax=Bacillus sp. FSL W8-0223 TaxID=2954595 RepID=UPI0030FBB611
MTKPSAIQLALFFNQFELKMIEKGRANIAAFAAKQYSKYIQKHFAEKKDGAF